MGDSLCSGSANSARINDSNPYSGVELNFSIRFKDAFYSLQGYCIVSLIVALWYIVGQCLKLSIYSNLQIFPQTETVGSILNITAPYMEMLHINKSLSLR